MPENVERRQAMTVVRGRDQHMCIGVGRLPEPCYGPLNGHEIITRAQGGSITDPRNIVLLCDHHNEWCDLNHDEAIRLGFRQSRTDPFSSKVALRLPQEIAPRPNLTLLETPLLGQVPDAGEALTDHLNAEWGLTWPEPSQSQKPGASLRQGTRLPNERKNTHGTH